MGSKHNAYEGIYITRQYWSSSAKYHVAVVVEQKHLFDYYFTVRGYKQNRNRNRTPNIITNETSRESGIIIYIIIIGIKLFYVHSICSYEKPRGQLNSTMSSASPLGLNSLKSG